MEYTLLERTSDGVRVRLFFPEDCPYFDGHFEEGRRLLPAVAQVDIVCRAIRWFLDARYEVTDIPRVKFSKPIVPGLTLVLAIRHDGGVYAFSFSDADGVYAKGRLNG